MVYTPAPGPGDLEWELSYHAARFAADDGCRPGVLLRAFASSMARPGAHDDWPAAAYMRMEALLYFNPPYDTLPSYSTIPNPSAGSAGPRTPCEPRYWGDPDACGDGLGNGSDDAADCRRPGPSGTPGTHSRR